MEPIEQESAARPSGVVRSSERASSATFSGKRGLRSVVITQMAFGLHPIHEEVTSVTELTWTRSLNAYLHRHYVHTFLNGLLIVDLLLLAISMNVELHFKDSIIKAHERKCEEGSEGGGDGHRLLEGDPHAGACSVHGNPALHNAERVIISFSVAILVIFLIDNLLLLFCNGRKFLKNAFCVADLVVVVVSIWFELQGGGDQLWVGMLIVGRTWRFVRIGHGLFELGHHEEEEEEEGKSVRSLSRF